MVRNSRLDLLRIVACVMVIAVHVGTLYGMDSNQGEPYYFFVGNLFHAFPRTPVPLFVMISGGFLLANERNKDFQAHYKKTFWRIIVPTFWFSLGYTLLSLGFAQLKGEPVDWIFSVKSWVLGWPYYHMWYMYMIIGCYAVTPFLIRLREKVGNRLFAWIGVLFLIIGLINYQTEVLWPFKFIFYLGYFIMGYCLKEWKLPKLLSWRWCLMGSILILGAMTALTYHRVMTQAVQPFYFVSSLSVTVMASALLMYVAFLNLPVLNLNLGRLAGLTFYIYLFHAGVLDIVDFIVRHVWHLEPNPVWYLPVLTVVIFYLSFVLSSGIEWMIRHAFSPKLTVNVKQQ